MRFPQFDLKLLVYLDALIAEKSVSKAAARVFITQSAMSGALSRMREYFNDELLIATPGKKIILTPLAESLTVPVRNILLEAQSVTNTSAEFHPSQSNRKFSVMASDYVVDVVLRRVVVRLAQEAPGIRVELRRLSPISNEEIKRTDLDLLIAPGSMVSMDLPTERLWQDTMICVAWSQNPLVGSEISLEQFLEMGHVSIAIDGHAPSMDQWVLNAVGKARKVDVSVPMFNMIFPMVEGTNRIAIVHLHHAKMFAERHSLKLIEPPLSFPPVTELMQWHRHQELDPALVWFRNFIKMNAQN
jgi:DNA-binding transcriptional LysR family regulator